MEIFIGAIIVIAILSLAYFIKDRRGEPIVPPVLNKELNARQAYRMIQKYWETNKLIIIDLRSEDEYQAGHIIKAKHKCFCDDTFEKDIQELDKDKKYLIYCKNGISTGKYPGNASEVFERNNFKHVYTLRKGFFEWKSAKYPIIIESYETATT